MLYKYVSVNSWRCISCLHGAPTIDIASYIYAYN